MKSFKKVIAGLALATTTLLGTAVGPASADTKITQANNRVAQYIKLTNNKGESSGINLGELKKQDARFIGIYLTNFLIPYATVINGNDDVANTIKENMKKHLVDVLGMSESDALALSDWVFAEMRNSSTDLKWKFSNEGTAETGAGMVEPPKDFIPTSNYELQKMLAGEFLHDKSIYPTGNSKFVFSKTGDERMEEMKAGLTTKTLAENEAEFVKKFFNEDLRYAYLVDSKDNILFSLDTTGGVMTPSVAALMQSVSIADPNQGYGSNFFDMDTEGLKNSVGGLTLVKEDSTLMSKITADSFGNLHLKGKNTDTIILPGASNPWVWKLKDNKGGQGVPLQNAMFMAASAKGGIVSPSDIDKVVSQCTFTTTNVEKAREELTVEGDIGFRYVLGSEERDFGSGRWTFWNNNTEGRTADKLLGEIASGASYYTYLEGQNGIRGGLPTYYFGGRPGQTATFGTMSMPCAGNVIIFDKDALYNSPAVKNASSIGTGTGTTETEKEAKKETSPAPETPGVQDGSANAGKDDGSNPEEGESTVTKGTDKIEGFTALQALQSDGTINAGNDGAKFQAKAELMDEGMRIAGSEEVMKGIADTTKIFDEYTAYSVYFTYLVALLGDESGQNALGLAGNTDEGGNLRLPSISDPSNFAMTEEAKQLNEEALQSQMDIDIKQWIYNLLHPGRTQYAEQLVSNKASAFILNEHNRAIGVTNSKVVSGTTQYTGISGYITTPELKDIQFTKAIYDGYYKNFVYIALAFLVFMLIYWIFGQLNWKQAIIGFVLLSTLAYTAFGAVDLSINASNKINDSIYSKKVLYWAMYQNQAYTDEINTAATADTYEDYLAKQYSQLGAIDINGNEDQTGNTIGTGSIMLKWQAGKKLNSLVLGNGELDKSITGIESAFAKQGIAALNSTISGESYLNYDATYMYRSYIDANNYARYMYSGYNTGIAKYNAEPSTDAWVESLASAWSDRAATHTSTQEFGYNLKTNSNLRYEPFMSSKIIDDALSRNTLENLTQNDSDNIGVDTRYFNFGIPNYTKNSEVMATVEANVEARAGNSRDNATMDGFSANGGEAGYTNEDYYGLGAHAVYSESPYYYFSWNLYDQGLKSTAGTDGYKELLLGTAHKSYFYNVEGNGGMRDYNDMRSLFTYVIPRLNQGNEIVRDFDRTYGLKYEVGVPATEGHWNDEGIADNPERAQKYWKNLQIARLYGIYSPWVDQLYATKYADSETIKVQGKDVIIDNPLDPASYPEDRPMIFSESEMMDYGLEENQLTQVEAKILKIQRNQMDNMVDMLNYYNFEDSVLNTAVSMQNTFEFNKEFSDFRLFQDSITLYPQAFEQQNFSWDVYLRMYLASNTKEDITSTSGTQFYANLVANTGIMTAVLLLVSDYLAGTAYPLMRSSIIWIVAVMILFHIFLMAVRSRTPKESARGFFSGILVPLAAIFLVSVGYGWLFSLFMQSGSKGVTGSSQELAFSWGSPVWALIFLIVINLGIVILLWNMAVRTVKTAHGTIKATVESVKGVAQSAQNIIASVSNGESFASARASAGGGSSAGLSGGSANTASTGTGGVSTASTGTGGTSTTPSNSKGTGGVLGGRGVAEANGAKESDYTKEDDFSAFGKPTKANKSGESTEKDKKLMEDIATKSSKSADKGAEAPTQKLPNDHSKPYASVTPTTGTATNDKLDKLSRLLDEKSKPRVDEPTKPLKGFTGSDDPTRPLGGSVGSKGFGGFGKP